MRITRTAATLALVLTAACGNASPMEPAGRADQSPAKTPLTRPSPTSPRFGNGMMGSGA